jgi:hypothetical protein
LCQGLKRMCTSTSSGLWLSLGCLLLCSILISLHQSWVCIPVRQKRTAWASVEAGESIILGLPGCQAYSMSRVGIEVMNSGWTCLL